MLPKNGWTVGFSRKSEPVRPCRAEVMTEKERSRCSIDKEDPSYTAVLKTMGRMSTPRRTEGPDHASNVTIIKTLSTGKNADSPRAGCVSTIRVIRHVPRQFRAEPCRMGRPRVSHVPSRNASRRSTIPNRRRPRALEAGHWETNNLSAEGFASDGRFDAVSRRPATSRAPATLGIQEEAQAPGFRQVEVRGGLFRVLPGGRAGGPCIGRSCVAARHSLSYPLEFPRFHRILQSFSTHPKNSQ